MARVGLNIAFFSIWTFAVLFSQVGVPYLHDKHDAHEYFSNAQKDKTSFHKHGEHCKVCSADLFLALFVASDVVFDFPQFEVTTHSNKANDLRPSPVSCSRGRGPPQYFS